jgi:phosphate uptake regulator
LPKPWAEKYGISKGSLLAISETDDGRLQLNPKYDAEPSPRSVTLRPGPYLNREIVGTYLLGFDIVRVEAKDRVNSEVRETVKKAVSRLIGLEIVEEDYSSIVLQCLLNPSGFPPEKILCRGYAIAAGMHRDSINAFIGGDVHLAKSIIDRDEEVNRLYFLLVRILRTIIQNASLSEKLGVRQIECLDYRLVASLVEAIGDECVRVAQKVDMLKGIKLAENLKKVLVAFHTACFEAHEEALNAFLTGDIKLAEKVRNMRESTEKTFADIEKVARAQSLDAMPQVLSVSSSLRQIYEHGVDIADLVMPKRE